jgi:hypothetical protein
MNQTRDGLGTMYPELPALDCIHESRISSSVFSLTFHGAQHWDDYLLKRLLEEFMADDNHINTVNVLQNNSERMRKDEKLDLIN